MPTTTIRRRNKGTPDSYLDLIGQFPLKTIKSGAAHDRALTMVSKLVGRTLDPGAGDYLDTLLVLVSKYEDEHHPIRRATPRAALKLLMSANRLTQADIGRIIGSESVVSLFLKGKRELSKDHIRKLAQRFKVSASLFLG